MNEVDWSLLDAVPEDDCKCMCGTIYRSHAWSVVSATGRWYLVSRKPCPGCGTSDGVEYFQPARS